MPGFPSINDCPDNTFRVRHGLKGTCEVFTEWRSRSSRKEEEEQGTPAGGADGRDERDGDPVQPADRLQAGGGDSGGPPADHRRNENRRSSVMEGTKPAMGSAL